MSFCVFDAVSVLSKDGIDDRHRELCMKLLCGSGCRKTCMIDLIKRATDISKYVLERVQARLDELNDGWKDFASNCLVILNTSVDLELLSDSSQF
jgi:hypothetical protein